jgi:hypothetical protein
LEIVECHEAAQEKRSFRIRLRVRVGKQLDVDEEHVALTICGRPVRLSAQARDAKIKDSEWLVFGAGGFATDDEATEFGQRLKIAVQLSAISTRVGADAGADLVTTGFGDTIKQSIRQEAGSILRDNVHGLDVYEDDTNVMFLSLSASGTVRATAKDFIDELDQGFDGVRNLSDSAKDILLLLNAALMNNEPVAQIVFAISAVEMLGQNECWSGAHKKLIKELLNTARNSGDMDANERTEVEAAVSRMHPISLRQGVQRLMNSLDLAALWVEWEAVYDERSRLVEQMRQVNEEGYVVRVVRGVEEVAVCVHRIGKIWFGFACLRPPNLKMSLR